MSEYDEVLLLCEDMGGRPSVRLLEVARQRLVAELPIAASVDIKPVGGESNLRPLVHSEREQKRRAFAVRDRDFLERSLVERFRTEHFTEAVSVYPWPLSRHCIESYLLDAAFLARALPGPKLGWAEVVEELARARRWTDIAKATVNDLNWRLREARGSTRGKGDATNRDEAIALVRAACAGLHPKIEAELVELRSCRWRSSRPWIATSEHRWSRWPAESTGVRS